MPKKNLSRLEIENELLKEMITRQAADLASLKAANPGRRFRADEIDLNEGKNWKKEFHICSNKTCKHKGKARPVDPDFGTRKVKGTTYKQSRCKDCRAQIHYHTRLNRKP